MAKEYIKHNREVTPEELQNYGKYATHDIAMPILLLYPAGTINDKNGTPVKIDDEFIKFTMKATNAAIRKRYSSPFAKIKSFFTDSIEDYEIIPLLKNHDPNNVDGLVGHTKGLCYIQNIEGIDCLLIKGIIKDAETKKRIDGDLFRNTSLGTRNDGSIKEISIVSNEALAHGGFLMSEESTTTELQKPSKRVLLLSEQISELQLAENTLSNVTIPNHIVLARMIKNGKIEPWKYDELIKQPTQVVELMERSLPSNKLGIMYGTQKHPQTIDQTEKIINDIVAKRKPEKGKIKLNEQHEGLIVQEQSFEVLRKKELSHIFELQQHSPEIAKKYIAYELGEEVDPPQYNDKYLSEYIEQSKAIKQQLNQLQIQLGECSNE